MKKISLKEKKNVCVCVGPFSMMGRHLKPEADWCGHKKSSRLAFRGSFCFSAEKKVNRRSRREVGDIETKDVH